jgi:hypothetical protein
LVELEKFSVQTITNDTNKIIFCLLGDTASCFLQEKERGKNIYKANISEKSLKVI